MNAVSFGVKLMPNGVLGLKIICKKNFGLIS